MCKGIHGVYTNNGGSNRRRMVRPNCGVFAFPAMKMTLVRRKSSQCYFMLILTWVQAISTSFPNGSCVWFNLLTAVLHPADRSRDRHNRSPLTTASTFLVHYLSWSGFNRTISHNIFHVLLMKRCREEYFVASNKFLSFS